MTSRVHLLLNGGQYFLSYKCVVHYWDRFDVCSSSPLHPRGCGVNLGMRSLESMGAFIYRTATAVDENDILEALSAKMQHSRHLAESFKQTGLIESMYDWGTAPSSVLLLEASLERDYLCLQWIMSLLKWTTSGYMLSRFQNVGGWIKDADMWPWIYVTYSEGVHLLWTAGGKKQGSCLSIIWSVSDFQVSALVHETKCVRMRSVFD